MFEMDAALDAVLDLRDPSLCTELSLDNPPYCFVDKEICRMTARRLRLRTAVQALVVPSLGLLDRRDARILALFVDKLASFPEPFVTAVQPNGVFGLMDDAQPLT